MRPMKPAARLSASRGQTGPWGRFHRVQQDQVPLLAKLGSSPARTSIVGIQPIMRPLPTSETGSHRNSENVLELSPKGI